MASASIAVHNKKSDVPEMEYIGFFMLHIFRQKFDHKLHLKIFVRRSAF